MGSPDPREDQWVQSSNCCWFFGSASCCTAGCFCLPRHIPCKGVQQVLPLPTLAPLLPAGDPCGTASSHCCCLNFDELQPQESRPGINI